MEYFKENLPMIIAIVIAIAVLGLVCYFLEFHKSVYYTQIDNTKVEMVSATDDMRYKYTLDCYNEDGKKKEIEFKTSRELREEAYLELEVLFTGVHSWKEIQHEELPDKVKTNYEK